MDPPHCVSWSDPWTYFLCFAHPEPSPQPTTTNPATEPIEIPDIYPNSEVRGSETATTQVPNQYTDSDYETEMLEVNNNQDNMINRFEQVDDEFCSSFLNF